MDGLSAILDKIVSKPWMFVDLCICATYRISVWDQPTYRVSVWDQPTYRISVWDQPTYRISVWDSLLIVCGASEQIL